MICIPLESPTSVQKNRFYCNFLEDTSWNCFYTAALHMILWWWHRPNGIFIFIKLMPDVTFIDLTCICNSDNITFYSQNGWIFKVIQAVSVVIWMESELISPLWFAQRLQFQNGSSGQTRNISISWTNLFGKTYFIDFKHHNHIYFVLDALDI